MILSDKKMSIFNILNRSVTTSITVLTSLCVFVVFVVQVLRFFQEQHINEIYVSKHIRVVKIELDHINEHIKNSYYSDKIIDKEHVEREISEFRQSFNNYYDVVVNNNKGNEEVEIKKLSDNIEIIITASLELISFKDKGMLTDNIYNKIFKRRYEAANEILKNMIVKHNNNISEYRNRHDRVESICLFTFITIVISLCFVIGKNRKLLISSIFKPLEKLKYAVCKITDGEYGFKIEDEYNNELGDLCHIINLMSVEVLKSRESLLEAKAETEKSHMQLVESHKMASIGVMSSGIAHELSQPLGVILLKSQLISILIDRSQYDKIKREYEVVESQILRAKRIIDSLRIISREGKAEEKAIMDINKLIESVVTLFNDDFRLSGIKLNLKLTQENPGIYVSQVQFCQILANIVSNARDAVRNEMEPVISVYSRVDNEKVYIVVEDNGVGISKEHIGRIFEPFYTLKDVGKGTGLGLSLCHSMVHENDGTISVESSEGKGASFTLSFPNVDKE